MKFQLLCYLFRYVVYGGTPSFILTVAGSDFEKDFLEKYKD
jgi:hypothetical protein